MSHVVTLVAGDAGRHALAPQAARLAAALAAPPPHWLAPDTACAVQAQGDPAAIEAHARAILQEEAIDVFVTPNDPALRRKRVLVADMESTIIENEMLDELADFLGLREEVSAITFRAMNGELDFVAALDARVALLKGLPDTVLAEAAQRIRIMPGASSLVATMRRNGALTLLVSGGFTVFAEAVGARLGFDRVVANHLDLAEGRLAGTVRRPIVTRETKREILLGAAAEKGVSAEAALSVGDGANDLPMLLAAGLGVAFRAKPAVAAAAHFRVDHADLTALLYAQGYGAAEIVATLVR